MRALQKSRGALVQPDSTEDGNDHSGDRGGRSAAGAAAGAMQGPRRERQLLLFGALRAICSLQALDTAARVDEPAAAVSYPLRSIASDAYAAIFGSAAVASRAAARGQAGAQAHGLGAWQLPSPQALLLGAAVDGVLATMAAVLAECVRVCCSALHTFVCLVSERSPMKTTVAQLRQRHADTLRSWAAAATRAFLRQPLSRELQGFVGETAHLWLMLPRGADLAQPRTLELSLSHHNSGWVAQLGQLAACVAPPTAAAEVAQANVRHFADAYARLRRGAPRLPALRWAGK